MQKNALHVSVSFRPRTLARKPGPTERPGSGLGWLRTAPGHQRATAPLGRGAATRFERWWDDGRRFPSKRRHHWQSLACDLFLYACICCLLALLALNMPQNKPLHRTGTLRFDCIFQTCQTQDGVASLKHATNKAVTRSTKTFPNVPRPASLSLRTHDVRVAISLHSARFYR